MSLYDDDGYQEFLSTLTVEKTQDEFGKNRFFVTGPDGDWLGDPFDTEEAAWELIDQLIEGNA
jgi:hypothetical protein